MRKYQWITIILGLITVLFVGCSGSDESDEVDYNLIKQYKNEVQEVDNGNKEEHGNGEDGHDHNVNKYSGNSEYWEALSSFKGIQSDYETPTLGNEPINLKTDQSNLLIVYSQEQDAWYYVNYGKDNYIYQMKDGKHQLLVERECDFINLIDDNLYFIGKNDSYIKNVDVIGDVYRYNLTTKELTLLVEGSIIYLYGSQDGLYYTDVNIEDLGDGYFAYHYDNLFLATGKDTPLKGKFPYYIPYKEYQVLYKYEIGTVLYNNLDESELPIASAENLTPKTSIYNDILYFIEGSNLYSLDLISGQKNNYDLSDKSKINLQDPTRIFVGITGGEEFHLPMIINDYTIYQDSIFLLFNQQLYQIKADEEGYIEMDTRGVYMEELYVAGEKLFGLISGGIENRESRFSLGEIKINDTYVVIEELQ